MTDAGVRIGIAMRCHLSLLKFLLLCLVPVLLVATEERGIHEPASVRALPAAQEADVPRFEEQPCQQVFQAVSWDSETLQRSRCGYLVTWENYEDQTGTVRLAVRVTQPDPDLPREPDAVVWLAGGPGGSGFESPSFDPLDFADAYGRDLVQFSQRGSGGSDPDLVCEGYAAAIVGNWQRRLDWKAWNSITVPILRRCADLSKQEHDIENIANFNSRYNALDVIYLIRSLDYGYGRANLYGASYGTLLAQHVLALSPGDIRSVILDAPAPLGVDWSAEYAQNLQGSLEEVFLYCASDPPCRQAHPNLEQEFYGLLESLAREPVTINVTHAGQQYRVPLDDQGFLAYLGHRLAGSGNHVIIPRIIDQAASGDLSEIEQTFDANYYPEARSPGYPWEMYYAVYCSEFARFNPGGVDPEKVDPHLRSLYDGSEGFINGVCPAYGRDENAYGEVQIEDNKVPVLIFNGRYDPLTTPRYGEQVARDLSISGGYSLHSPITAHGSILNDWNEEYDTCVRGIFKGFLDNPRSLRPPDTSWCWIMIKVKTDLGSLDERLQKSIEDTLESWGQSIQEGWQELWQRVRGAVEQAWQTITDALEKAWQDFQDWIANELEQWWQNLQRELLKFLQRLLMEWLSQCLGGALLPLGLLAGGWTYRRHSKNRR